MVSNRFVDSEVALDSSIHELLLLTQNPRQFYPELIKLGVAASLVDLLSHENVDISIAVIQVLEELTDDDVAEGESDSGDEYEEGDQVKGSSARSAVISLVQALLKAQVVELAADNLTRLNHEEQEEQDRSGVYHTLGLVENLLSLQPDLSASIATKTNLITWLLRRLQPAAGKKEKGKEEDPALAQNRYYAAELLAILLQGSEVGFEARRTFGRQGGIEVTLKVLSVRTPLYARMKRLSTSQIVLS